MPRHCCWSISAGILPSICLNQISFSDCWLACIMHSAGGPDVFPLSRPPARRMHLVLGRSGRGQKGRQNTSRNLFSLLVSTTHCIPDVYLGAKAMGEMIGVKKCAGRDNISHWGTPELAGLRTTLLCNAVMLILFLNSCWWLVLGQDHALLCPIELM